MKLLFVVLSLLAADTAAAHKCECRPRDDQNKLATACETNLSDVNTRLRCLESARLVATMEFCSRQYGSSEARVKCITEVDINQ